MLSYQLEEGIIGSKTKYEYEYRNITSTVKGPYNIKEVTKADQDQRLYIQ